SNWLAWAALTVFVAVPLLPALMQLNGKAWLILTMATAILTICAISGIERYLMYLPPIFIPISVLILFARSLRSGQIPVVTRVALQIRGTLPPELESYTRRVTQCWVVLLIGMAVSSLLLALCATPELWSLMTNVIQYLVLAAIFLFEYLFRRWYFRHLNHESFPAMVMALFRTRMN
ncbi:MAG: hypothetical protein ABUL58_07175, partial [Steroidobacter sp.]